MSNRGRWDDAYKSLTQPSPYGDTASYTIAEKWLSNKSIEDWGCGKGWFKTIHQGPYLGIDGSKTPYADVITDLTSYRSACDSILIRHVLEHDQDWPAIWNNALASANRTIVLILFTPLSHEGTKELNIDSATGVPDLSPDTRTILLAALRAGKDLVHVEHMRSKTRYGQESILIFQPRTTNQTPEKIPKIIHQFWDGPDQPPTHLLNEVRHTYQAAGWDYKLWDRKAIEREFPEGRLKNQTQFEQMPEWSGKCDIARYEILHKEGGFFIDADTKPYRPIEDMFLEHEFFATYENELLRPGIVACGYMGSKPGNQLLEYIINKIALLEGNHLHPDAGQQSTRQTLAWKTVGPLLLTKAVQEARYREIAIFPSFFFIPNHYLRQREEATFNGSFKPYFDSLWGSTPGSSFRYKGGAIAKEHPKVSICTLTYQRPIHLQRLLKCIETQDYPLEKIEWIILDDSPKEAKPPSLASSTKLTIKHQVLHSKIKLGAKRNLAHKLCSGEIIVYMDDDDFYPPNRVSHAVEVLQNCDQGIAGSTLLPIYFTVDNQLWVSGPFGNNHATAGTFALTREFARSHFYDPEATCNEERSFLNNYSLPMAQLDPSKTMICISHSGNTFDKNKMRANGPTARMKPARAEDFHALLERFDPNDYKDPNLDKETIP